MLSFSGLMSEHIHTDTVISLYKHIQIFLDLSYRPYFNPTDHTPLK